MLAGVKTEVTRKTRMAAVEKGKTDRIIIYCKTKQCFFKTLLLYDPLQMCTHSKNRFFSLAASVGGMHEPYISLCSYTRIQKAKTIATFYKSPLNSSFVLLSALIGKESEQFGLLVPLHRAVQIGARRLHGLNCISQAPTHLPLQTVFWLQKQPFLPGLCTTFSTKGICSLGCLSGIMHQENS